MRMVVTTALCVLLLDYFISAKIHWWLRLLPRLTQNPYGYLHRFEGMAKTDCIWPTAGMGINGRR